MVAALELGNVLIAIQPPRGYGEDPVGIYHDPELPPTHHYLACYRFLEAAWGADAIVHLGKHGTLEWLPGKMLALSAECAPDAALGDMPLVYPFIVNDPGEGVQAKRRAHAVIVDHLVPPMMRAESYDELAELEALLDEYARLEILDPPKLPGLAVQIWDAIERANLQTDLGVAERPDDLGLLVEHIDGYLCEVKDIQVKDGLHVLGVPPAGPQLRGLVSAMLRLDPSDDVRGLRSSVAAALELDEAALATTEGADRLHDVQMALLDALAAREWSARGGGRRVRRGARPRRRRHRRRAALRLRDRRAAPGADDRRADEHRRRAGRPPRPGRAVRRADARAPRRPADRPQLLLRRPARAAVAAVLGDRPAARPGAAGPPRRRPRRAAADGRPRRLGDERDAHAGRRRGGDLRAARRAAGVGARVAPRDGPGGHRAGGARPAADRRHRADLGLLPRRLPAPRADARRRGRARGGARRAVRRRTSSPPTPARTPPRWPGELDAAPAWRQATTRIFGSKPGAYGAGLAQLLDARDWRGDGDLAEVYEAWGGYAYGRGLDGAQASDAHRTCFGRIDVAVKNVDSREHDILDSGDYYEYHGGMVATVRAISGREPAAVLGDSSDPARVVTRSLAQETRRVFRARVANPRWIASMIRHGYKGAAELAATVDYLFGYDATTGVAEDWMYEDVARKYLLDADVGAFMGRSNPWAARAIAERLHGGGRPRAVVGAGRRDDERDPRALPRARGRAGGGVGVVSVPGYPFSAIVGQAALREALLVNAVSPEVGGVLVRGERGTAKSTAVRALAPLLPAVPAAAGRPFCFAPGDLAPGRRRRRPTRRWRSAPRRSSSCRSARRSTASSARWTSAARWPASAPSRPGCWRARTAACSTSTRSTCCPTISSTSCSTPPRWASATSSATRSRCATTRASCSSAR